MNHKLKKPLVSSFMATDTQIAYLSLASGAYIMNTSAINGIPRGRKLAKDTRSSILGHHLLKVRIPRYFNTLKFCF